MLFADQALAQRIETAEKNLVISFARALQARGSEEVALLPFAGGLAVFAGKGCPFTKTVGLGFDATLDEAEIEHAVRFFAERSTPLQVEVSTLADPAVGAMLTGRGFRLVNYENVSARRLDEVPFGREPDALEIRPVNEELSAAWCRTVSAGFATPDTEGVQPHEHFDASTLEPLFELLAEVHGYRRYVARWEGTPAAGASMTINDGIAQLNGAAVLPEYRRRGIQTALANLRLQHAREAGCEMAVVTTQPGSRSQLNVLKQGFHLLYPRAVLVKEP